MEQIVLDLCIVYTNILESLCREPLPNSEAAVRESAMPMPQPGDLICYAGHIGIYIGNGKIVHASSPSTGIKVGNAAYRSILAVRRIVQ